jgi:hypothetical protein
VGHLYIAREDYLLLTHSLARRMKGGRSKSRKV